MKVRIWARVARAFFNSMGLAILAMVSVIIGATAVNLIALHLDTITAALFPEVKITPVPALPAIGLSLAVFFAFLSGGIGIELSKDLEATEKASVAPAPAK